MKNNDLLDAIGRVDEKWKQEVITHMSKNTKSGHFAARPSPVRRTLRMIPAAAAIICLLAVTAYAAVNYWGIFDFQKNTRNPLPSEAEALVQTQDEVGSDDFVTCQVTETLTDGQNLYLTVRMQSKEPGKYGLLFQMDEPTMPADYFGADYDGTLEEYAKEHDMTLMMVGVGVKQLGEGGTGVQSIQEKHQAPDTMDFLITCNIADVGSDTEGVFTYTIHEPDAAMEDVHRGEIPFSFTNESASTENVYHPDSQPIDGMEFGDATVTETELATIVEFPSKETNKGAAYNFMFRRVDGADYREGGGVYDESGNLFYHLEFAKEEFGDSFILEAYNHSTDEVFGRIEFKK